MEMAWYIRNRQPTVTFNTLWLSYVDSTKTVNISKLSPLAFNNFKITSIRISPLSLNIDGSYNTEYAQYPDIKDFYVQLKDKSIQCTKVNGYYCRLESDNKFEMGTAFTSPIMLDLVEMIILKQYDSKQNKYIDFEIPVKY